MKNDNESLAFTPLSGVVVNTTKIKKLTVVQPRRKVSAERLSAGRQGSQTSVRSSRVVVALHRPDQRV